MWITTWIVKVVYPLKQGLKPFKLETPLAVKLLVKVVYPLKQGLKLESI